MSLPHSNADVEGIFSALTVERAGSEVMNAITVTRYAFSTKGIKCTNFKPREKHRMLKVKYNLYLC